MTQEELNQVESSQRQHFDCMAHQEKMNLIVEQEEYNLFSMLKPKLYKDQNTWCCLLGEDIISGISGFGDTPYLAILDWQRSFHKN